MIDSPKCSVENCSRDRNCKGFCRPHYNRYREGRDLNTPLKDQDKITYCVVDNCLRESVSFSMCALHYNRTKKGIKIDAILRGNVTTCKVEGCDRRLAAKGFCSAHYQRYKSNQELNSPIGAKNKNVVCSVKNCDLPVEGRMLCKAHYSAKRRKDGYELLLNLLGDFCRLCNKTYPVCVYDFHHKDASTKKFSISSYVGNSSTDKLIEEALKCEILCANCHRIRHSEKLD